MFLRVNSHRAGDRLAASIGRKPQYYYTWEHGGIFAEVTDDEYERVRTIKGLTRRVSLLTSCGSVGLFSERSNNEVFCTWSDSWPRRAR